MSFTLRQKIFLGYIVMISFTLLVGFYAIFSLKELNTITQNAVFNSIATSGRLTKLNDSMLAQDLYEKRFLMLKQRDAENLFWARSKEFREILAEISKTETYIGPVISSLLSLHDRYNADFTREEQLVKENKVREAEEVSAGDMKIAFEKILLGLRDVDQQLKSQQNKFISESNSLSERSLLITIILSATSFAFGL
ncbi:MAG TPA: hypothetical protein VEP69_06495, partial [Thermodesulfovibrionales bacterium]|nr:hypothetical protein [Thermodesulfovibrionales bacterium]